MREKLFVRFSDAGEGAPSSLSGVLIRYGDVASMGSYKETFEAGAFENLGNVIVNSMHDRRQPLARAGNGLTLRDSKEMLEAEIVLPNTTLGRDTAELVRSGVLTGLSMEFVPKKERYSGGIRVIQKAHLAGLAIVDDPAYPDSRITKRRRWWL